MTIIGIDPGTHESAVVVYALGHAVDCWTGANEDVLAYVAGQGSGPEARLAIETIGNYGMPVGQSTFDTLIWIGRFVQAWSPHGKAMLLHRKTIVAHLCGTVRAKDAHVRQALINRFGGDRRAAVGTKKVPGPLYGIKYHEWSALAVAVYVADTMQEAGE